MGDVLKFRTRAMREWGRWWRLKQRAAAAQRKGPSPTEKDVERAENPRPSLGPHHMLDEEEGSN
jgi:hypothetical protein